MQDSTAYIGLDVHSCTCTMVWTGEEDTYRGPSTFQTSGQILRERVGQIRAKEKAVTLEEGPLAFWTARVLEDIVDQIVVCDQERTIWSADQPVKTTKSTREPLPDFSDLVSSKRSTNRKTTTELFSSKPRTITRIFEISNDR